MSHPFPQSNRVVIVDDSAVERARLSGVLRQMGLEPVEVASSDNALEQVRKHGPLFAIFDVVMPPPNGFELCRQMRAAEDLRGVPIVLCSVKSTAVDRMWARRLGAVAYLAKPVDPERARHFLSVHLSRIRQEGAAHESS